MLKMDDNRVMSALWEASGDGTSCLNLLANRIIRREHFKTLYELNPSHKSRKPTIVGDIANHLFDFLGAENVRFDTYGPKSEANSFRVLNEQDELDYSKQVSDVIKNIPGIEVGLVFVEPNKFEAAKIEMAKKFRSTFTPRGSRTEGRVTKK